MYLCNKHRKEHLTQRPHTALGSPILPLTATRPDKMQKDKSPAKGHTAGNKCWMPDIRQEENSWEDASEL